MNTEHQAPDSEPDQLDISSRLGTVTRFNPRPGFRLRVLRQVRHPLPRWARRLRDWYRGMVTGVRGWVILGSLSAASAAAWTVAIVEGMRSGAVARAWELGILHPEVRDAAWEAREAVTAFPGEAIGALEATGLPWEALAVGYGVLVVVSAAALWRLTKTRPDRVRMQQ